MSFQSLTPEFRDALRNMADVFAEKNVKEKPKEEKADDKIQIRIAMNEDVEIIEDEGNSTGADNK